MVLTNSCGLPLCVYAFLCVCGVFVYVCLPAPSHCPLSSGAQRRTETRLWHAAGLRPCAFLSLALWCLALPGSKRLTEHPLRGFPPFYFFYTAFSHAAVKALGVGDAL